MFQRVDLQLFLRFEPQKLTKRIVNRLAGGVLTNGEFPAPIQKYCGATSRLQVKDKSEVTQAKCPAAKATGLNESDFADDQADSSGNVNRDDKTPLERFLAGLMGWEGGLRRSLNTQESASD